MPGSRWIAALILSLSILCGARAQEVDELYRRGQALLDAGKLAEAARAFERVLALAERALGPDDPRLAVDLNNLGEVYRRLGRLEEAARLLERAIRLDEAAGGNGAALAISLNNLGLVRRAQGRLAESEALFQRAIGLLEPRVGPDHPDLARVLVNLAQLELERGDSERARERLERAVRIARARLGTEHSFTRGIETVLARLEGGTSPTRARAAALAPAAAPAARAPTPPERPAAVTTSGVNDSGMATPVAAPTMEPAAVAAGGPFRLHLGSIRDAGRLEEEWQRLKSRHPRLAQLALQPPQRVEIPGKGSFWRVIAGPLPTRAEAAALCGAITAAGDPCTVLGP